MREEVKIKLLENLLEEVTKKYDYFISLQDKKIQQTFEMAVKDPLTELYNRQYLSEYAKKAFQRVTRHESVLILIFIDLDNFKYVNDSFGHKEGDKVLKQVGEILRKTFRNYDIIVRYGGDEFVILIEDIHFDSANIEKTLLCCVKRVEEKLNRFKISASYGYSLAPNGAMGLEELIESADEKMYAQKQRKKFISCN